VRGQNKPKSKETAPGGYPEAADFFFVSDGC
jgi:hypothetical protein